MRRRRTDRQRSATNGFVVVDDLLTDDELDALRAARHRRRRVPRPAATSAPLEERSPYQQSFQQCINLWEDHEALRPLTFHQRIGQAAGELLGVPALRLWHDQALYKRAHGRETDPHQDQPYWPIAETDTITAWIPLQGSTIANGAMGYLPGLAPRRPAASSRTSSWPSDASEFMESPEIAGIEPVYVEVPPRQRGVPPRAHGAHGEAEHDRRRSRRAHDDHVRRRLHARLEACSTSRSTATASKSAR